MDGILVHWKCVLSSETGFQLCEVDFGFGFDYGEDGDVGMGGGVKGAPGIVKGVGYGGEHDGALVGADEEEFQFAVNETRCGGEWQV